MYDNHLLHDRLIWEGYSPVAFKQNSRKILCLYLTQINPSLASLVNKVDIFKQQELTRLFKNINRHLLIKSFDKFKLRSSAGLRLLLIMRSGGNTV